MIVELLTILKVALNDGQEREDGLCWQLADRCLDDVRAGAKDVGHQAHLPPLQGLGERVGQGVRVRADGRPGVGDVSDFKEIRNNCTHLLCYFDDFRSN